MIIREGKFRFLMLCSPELNLDFEFGHRNLHFECLFVVSYIYSNYSIYFTEAYLDCRKPVRWSFL